MEHIDIWSDIVDRNASLALILEDDAVFVPFFREKLERTIFTAIRTGALKIGGLSQCAPSSTHLPTASDEWFEQDPMIVIGSCMLLFDSGFNTKGRDSPPMLSTHKAAASRCSHAYLLTACSARALLKQIAATRSHFLQSDLLLDALVAASPTLQSFWLDPPIAYQGNRITDLDGIPSFGRTTYADN
jgi:GR25 family glycosyltransferase involved in LPS biosynthesis